jgi:hypothetical protein
MLMTQLLFADLNDYIKNKLTHSLHTSERRSFRGCRRRWCWIFRDFYYPITTAKPLEFGVAFHKAMEVLYAPMTWHDKELALALALVAFRDTIEAQKREYVRLHGELGEESEIDYKERLELGLSMLKYYAKTVIPKEDRNLTPVKVEVSFEVFIKNPDYPDQDAPEALIWCKCDNCWDRYVKWVQNNTTDYLIGEVDRKYGWKGLPVSYGGRIDAVIKDNYGRFWVFDWKTAASLTAAGDDDYLWWDDQITSYCWALWVLGVDIAGFIYAEIKKAAPDEPEPLKNIRMGRRYSVNKQMAYDPATYELTVQENDPIAYEQGLYDDYLEYLRSPENRFGQRHEIHRTDVELQEAGRNIYLEALDMIDPGLRIYPSPGRFACRTCAFAGPCLSRNRQEDYSYELDTAYEKRSYHYWEHKLPSTESKGGE